MESTTRKFALCPFDIVFSLPFGYKTIKYTKSWKLKPLRKEKKINGNRTFIICILLHCAIVTEYLRLWFLFEFIIKGRKRILHENYNCYHKQTKLIVPLYEICLNVFWMLLQITKLWPFAFWMWNTTYESTIRLLKESIIPIYHLIEYCLIFDT